MTDSHRPDGTDDPWRPNGPGEPSGVSSSAPIDPAYAGQLPIYPPSGYPPQSANPTAQPPPQPWAPPPSAPIAPPPVAPAGVGPGRPPEGPQLPKWLWLAAAAAVLLVVSMVIALAIANGSRRNSARIPPVSTLPTAPLSPRPQYPPHTPSVTPSPTPSPPTSTSPSTPPPSTSSTPRAPETIVYSVSGTGRALSIAYIDTGGVLETEFNVALPWSKQVTLTPPASTAATVTVVNFGEQITCSLSIDGVQVRQHTGSLLTVCAAAG